MVSCRNGTMDTACAARRCDTMGAFGESGPEESLSFELDRLLANIITVKRRVPPSQRRKGTGAGVDPCRYINVAANKQNARRARREDGTRPSLSTPVSRQAIGTSRLSRVGSSRSVDKNERQAVAPATPRTDSARLTGEEQAARALRRLGVPGWVGKAYSPRSYEQGEG